MTSTCVDNNITFGKTRQTLGLATNCRCPVYFQNIFIKLVTIFKVMFVPVGTRRTQKWFSKPIERNRTKRIARTRVQ